MSDKGYRRYKQLKATRRAFFLQAAERLADAGTIHVDVQVGAFDTWFQPHGWVAGLSDGWVESAGPTWGNGGHIEWRSRGELLEILADHLTGAAANYAGVGNHIPLDAQGQSEAVSRRKAPMNYFRRLFDEADAASRARLDHDEVVLAVGACADITTTGDLNSAGGSWTYVMVTDKSLRWVPAIQSPEVHAVLALDAVHAAVDARWRQRCAIVLRHEEMVRTHWSLNRAENHEYTSNDWVTGPLTTTTLAFSHAHAKAADALRDQLEGHSISVETVDLPGPLPPE